jgi:alpha-L-rhamnosidase
VVPDVLKYLDMPPEFAPVDSAAVWSDAAVWVPWALWTAYGDAALLARHLPVMLAHVRHVAGMLSPSGLWDATFQFGDWLDPDAPPDQPWAAKADPGVVATASFYRSVVMTRDAARALAREDLAAELEPLADRLRAAFQAHFVHDGGLVVSDCQTVYALAIVFDLLDDGQRLVAGRRLAELVEDAGHRISTGFAGTPYVLDALTATGHLDAAYRMLLQPELPGWMYQVRMGATTMWERWDSMLPDGSINPGTMTSFNHYAFGSVADWLHRTVAGVSPLEPGYSRVLVAPRPGGGLTSASGSVDTPHGRVSVAWRLDEVGRVVVHVEVPSGVAAVVRPPDGPDQVIFGGEGRVDWS